MFYWVYDYPAWMLFIGLFLFFAVFSIGSIFTLRYLTDEVLGVTEEDNSIVAEYLGVTGIFFGLVLGMVAIGSWEAYNNARLVASHEATSAGVLYRSIELLPGDQGEPIEEELRQYMRTVIGEEWAEQREGRVPDAAEEELTRIGELIYAIPVETPAEEIAVGAANGLFYELVKARRDRLQTVANSFLPGSLWWVVVASTAMIISLSMLMRIDNTKLDITINLLMSVLTGSILGFIISMDNPYRGELSVPTTSYEIILEQQMSGR